MTNMSRAFWRADVKREPLQRVYAITFPDHKQLKEYMHRMEEVRLLFDFALLGCAWLCCAVLGLAAAH